MGNTVATMDRVLLERWVSTRDSDSFAELARRYSGMVYATCCRILGDATAAEDVAQECFEVLARWHGGPADYLGPWLHRVATTRSLNRLRAESRRRERELHFAAEPRRAEPGWDDLYDFVDEAIETLPEHLREPLMLHFFQNETHERIAQQLGTSRQTVTYRIAKGVERVRRFLKRRGVAVATPSLAGIMMAQLAHGTAPASLCETLVKLAIAGPATSGVTTWTGSAAVTGGVLAMKKTLMVCALGVIIASGMLVGKGTFKTRDSASTSSTTEEYATDDARTTLASHPEAPANAATDMPPEDPRERASAPVQNTVEKLAPGTQTPAPPRPRQIETNTVTGKVVYAGTGEPVTSFSVGYSTSRAPTLALVRSDAIGSMDAVQDVDGRFTLKSVSLARGATILVQAPGFADGIALVEPAAPTANVEVRVELTHGAQVSGIVVDTSHRPVAGADIYTGMLYVEKNAAPPGLTRTADNGRFTLEHIPIESFMVVAYKSGFAPGYANIALKEDETVETHIVLGAGGSVSGRVTKNGAPLPRRQIRAHASLAETAAMFSTTTDDDGTYLIAGLPAGETNIWAYGEMSGERGHPTVMGKTIAMEPGADVTADFDFTADARLSGTVYLHDEPTAARLHVSVDTLDGAWQEFHGSAGEDGAYTFDSLPAGRIALKAIPAARMSDNGFTAWQEELDIEGGNSLEYDIHIRDGLTLDGRVAGVAPEEVCAIEVLQGSVAITALGEPALALIRTLGVAHTEGTPDGAFRVENLQPGTFTVLGMVYDRTARNNLERLAGARFATVELDLTQDASIELTLEPVAAERSQ